MQPHAAVRKVLVYRIGSLGDTLVALPSLHLIARAFPHARRVLLTNIPIKAAAPAAAQVLAGSGLIDDFLAYRIGTRNPAQLLSLAWKIRRLAPDVLVYLMPVRPLRDVERDRKFLRLAGVKRIVGLPGPDGLAHRFDPSTGLYESEAARLARAISELGDAHAEDIASWNLHLTDVERQKARGLMHPLSAAPFIACAPGCKMQANDWEKENWRSLFGRISARHPGMGLLMAGGTGDADICNFAALDWLGPKVNLAGRLTPRETSAAFTGAQLFLGPDSGPKHLAASAGVPCVCVFSARGKPGVWFPPGPHNIVVYHQPECHGCNLETCIEMQKKCIRSVTVEEMEAAALRVLESQPSRTFDARLPAVS